MRLSNNKSKLWRQYFSQLLSDRLRLVYNKSNVNSSLNEISDVTLITIYHFITTCKKKLLNWLCDIVNQTNMLGNKIKFIIHEYSNRQIITKLGFNG